MLKMLATVFMAVLAAPTLSHAIVLDYNPAIQGTARGDGPWVIGTLFQVGPQNQLITHLGAQDADAAATANDPDGADGLTGFADDDGFVRPFIDVGLWDATGTTLLAQARVLTTDPVVDSWRWHALTSAVVLQANTQYLIGATVGAGIEWFIDDVTAPVPFTANPGFSLIQNRFISSPTGTLLAPTSNGTGVLGRWGAANAASLIPEPATATLLLLTGGLFIRRRRLA